MFFSVAFYLSASICVIGLIYRSLAWLSSSVASEPYRFSAGRGVAAAFKAILRAVFSRRINIILKALLYDVILQIHILKADLLRWVMHMSLFAGFLLLLSMHALDDQVTRVLFPAYESTLNPFLFLRNLFGAILLLGVGIALYRRIILKGLRTTTRMGDRFALVTLLVILVSGFALEGTQIVSGPIFDQMVEDYLGTEDSEDIASLKYYWAHDFAVVFNENDLMDTSGSAILEPGRVLSEESCAGCHSKPHAAFVSYPLARSAAPIAGFLNKHRADNWLWYVHILSCFIGLAGLPFSKFYHVISTPLQILLIAGENPVPDKTPHQEIRRSIAMDACTHCGVCTIQCSVAPAFRIIGNPNILPSEKLIGIKAMAAGKPIARETLEEIAEGSFICTNCLRCTQVCPSKIDLQDLWINSRQRLAEEGLPEPHIWIKDRKAAEWAALLISPGLSAQSPINPIKRTVNLTDRTETFQSCIQCQTCTDVCPVVADTDNPTRDLDLTPQQVMNLLRLGAKEMAMGSRMVWDCVTCYKCQEHCPQGVRVADVLYELRNLACRQLGPFKSKKITERDFDEDGNVEGEEDGEQ